MRELAGLVGGVLLPHPPQLVVGGILVGQAEALHVEALLQGVHDQHRPRDHDLGKAVGELPVDLRVHVHPRRPQLVLVVEGPQLGPLKVVQGGEVGQPFQVRGRESHQHTPYRITTSLRRTSFGQRPAAVTSPAASSARTLVTQASILRIIGLAEHVPTARPWRLVRRLNVRGRGLAPVVRKRRIGLADVGQQPLGGRLHLRHPSRVPPDDDLLAMLGRPLVGLCRPVRRVNVHPDHDEVGHQVLDGGADLQPRHLPVPVRRVPDRRQGQRTVPRSELVPVARLCPDHGPVVDVRTVHAKHDRCALWHLARLGAVPPLVDVGPGAGPGHDPVAEEALGLGEVALVDQLRGFGLDAVQVNVSRPLVDVGVDLPTVGLPDVLQVLGWRPVNRWMSFTRA